MTRTTGHCLLPVAVKAPAVQQQQVLQTPIPMAIFLALGTLVALGQEPLQ